MPRPIPDDPEGITGWQWFLLPVPDDPTYIEAAWDAFSELTKPWNWGKEGRVPDSDIAAQTWADAIYEALRVRDMGFPDLLLQYTDEVESLLRQLIQQSACCDFIPGGDQVIVGDDGDLEGSDTDIDGEVFPDGIADEDEMRDYLCDAASAWADEFANVPDRINALVSASIQSVILAILAYTGGAFLAISGTLIGGLFTLGEFFTVLGAIESILSSEDRPPGPIETALIGAKDDLVCAIVCANDAAGAGAEVRGVIADLELSTVWENLLFLWANNSVMARIFNGNSSAPSATCDCDCSNPALFTWDWSSGLEGWITANPNVGLVYNGSAVEVNADSAITARESNNPETGTQIATRFSLSTDIEVERVEFDISFTQGTGSQIRQQVRFGFWGQDDAVRWTDIADTDVIGYDNPVTIDTTLSTPALLRAGLVTAKIWANRDASAADGQRGLVTAIRCYGTEGN
jgi:hypothetical protein